MDNRDYINSVNLNDGTDFPYLVLDVINNQSYPRNPGFQVMHWHEDLQFIYVLAGEIEVVTLSDCIKLYRGEGVFINKSVVHLIRRIDTCHYNSFIFPDRFLKFYPGSPAERMVNRIVGQVELPIVAIRLTDDNREVLDVLRRLSEIQSDDDKKSDVYCYKVLTELCRLWLAFCKTVSAPESQPQNYVLEQRTVGLLKYIDTHYGDDVTLDALAASVSISKSECLRCFKAVLHTTPYRYLIEYRLSKAAEMLKQTDKPITDIALEVGFSHASHFGKCFRDKTGMSPGEYRKSR